MKLWRKIVWWFKCQIWRMRCHRCSEIRTIESKYGVTAWCVKCGRSFSYCDGEPFGD